VGAAELIIFGWLESMVSQSSLLPMNAEGQALAINR